MYPRSKLSSRLLAGVVAAGTTAGVLATGTVTAGASGLGPNVTAVAIAFDMPCSTCASRFEDQDKPDFIKAVHALDPTAKVIADNAQGSDATQIAQVEDALAN
jgi:D-xylose transport system substrate-binding protein